MCFFLDVVCVLCVAFIAEKDSTYICHFNEFQLDLIGLLVCSGVLLTINGKIVLLYLLSKEFGHRSGLTY